MHVLCGRVEILGFGFAVVNGSDVGMELPNHVDQERRRAGSEPVVANLLGVHSIEQAEGIVDAGRLGGKVVTVVLPFQLLQYIVLRCVQVLSQSADALLEVVLQFLLRDAA